MDKLIKFISSFKNLNLKELVFKELNLLPFLLGALLLVLILKWLINLKSKRRTALGVSSLALFKKERRFLRRLPEHLFVLGIVFLILCQLNPVLHLVKNDKKIEAKEIIIILDFSESMTHTWGEYAEEKPEDQIGLTKLDVERKYVTKFIENRKNDRIWLIVYSEKPYVVMPITSDHQNLISILKLFKIYPRGTAHNLWDTIIPGEAYTCTGDALFVANFVANESIKKYGGSKEKVIVLFTDGAKNRGREPVDALKEIAKSGFKVMLLGVDYESFQKAADQLAKDVKEITGGEFFPVDTEEDFKKAVSSVDRFTGKNIITIDEYIVDEPQYFYFGFLALVLFVLALFLKHLHYFRDLL